MNAHEFKGISIYLEKSWNLIIIKLVYDVLYINIVFMLYSHFVGIPPSLLSQIIPWSALASIYIFLWANSKISFDSKRRAALM